MKTPDLVHAHARVDGEGGGASRARENIRARGARGQQGGDDARRMDRRARARAGVEIARETRDSVARIYVSRIARARGVTLGWGARALERRQGRGVDDPREAWEGGVVSRVRGCVSRERRAAGPDGTDGRRGAIDRCWMSSDVFYLKRPQEPPGRRGDAVVVVGDFGTLGQRQAAVAIAMASPRSAEMLASSPLSLQ